MTIYRYPEIATYREHTGKCPGCGKRTRRKRKFWQTMSPFNRNENGDARTREEIEAAVNTEADEWRPDFAHAGCKEPADADQPSEVDPDADPANPRSLPDLIKAADRVLAFVSEWGDGRIDTAGGAHLFARDLEVVARHAQWFSPANDRPRQGDNGQGQF